MNSAFDVYTVAGSSRHQNNELDRLTSLKAKEANYQPDGGEEEIEWYEDESEGEDDSRFVNFSLLSHIAVRLRDRVPRGTHVKGSIPYPRAFTGKDIVVCWLSSRIP